MTLSSLVVFLYEIEVDDPILRQEGKWTEETYPRFRSRVIGFPSSVVVKDGSYVLGVSRGRRPSSFYISYSEGIENSLVIKTFSA